MNYSYYNDGTQKNRYVIREKNTNQDIMHSISGDLVQKFTAHLNRGAGFDGWTPSFFLSGIAVND